MDHRPEDLHTQLAQTRAQLQALTEDMTEVKMELKKITEILVHLSNVKSELTSLKEELVANAKSHDQIWQEIAKLRDSYYQHVHDSLPLLEWAKNMRSKVDKLVIALVTTAIISIIGWLAYVYRTFQ